MYSRSSDISLNFKWRLNVIKACYFLEGNGKENISLLFFWPYFSDSHQISTSQTVNGNDSRSHFIWKCGLMLGSVLAHFKTTLPRCAFYISSSLLCFPYTLNFNSLTVYWHDGIQTSALAEDIWDVNNLPLTPSSLFLSCPLETRVYRWWSAWVSGNELLPGPDGSLLYLLPCPFNNTLWALTSVSGAVL